MAQTTTGTGRAKPKAAFFDRADAEVHIPGQGEPYGAPPETDEDVRKMAAVYASLAGRLKLRVLFDQPDGFSLVESEIEPNVRVPRHKHNLAQLALILEGSMRQGNRVLGPGSGYFTPEDGPYTFTTGPEGCRYVEFRFGNYSDVTSTVLEDVESEDELEE